MIETSISEETPVKAAPVVPQSVNSVEPTIPQKNPPNMGVIIIIVLLIMVIVGVAAYFLGVQQTMNGRSILPIETIPNNQTICTLEAKICPDGSSVGRVGPNCEFAECPTENDKDNSTQSATQSSNQLPNECSNPAMGVSLLTPEDWSCTSETYSSTDGGLTISSDLFVIEISNLGRGPYCVNDPSVVTYDENCVVTPFFSNDTISLSMYSMNDVNHEIFGSIQSSIKNDQMANRWISVMYKHMDEDNLSADEKQQLMSVLETIKVTK